MSNHEMFENNKRVDEVLVEEPEINIVRDPVPYGSSEDVIIRPAIKIITGFWANKP